MIIFQTIFTPLMNLNTQVDKEILKGEGYSKFYTTTNTSLENSDKYIF